MVIFFYFMDRFLKELNLTSMFILKVVPWSQANRLTLHSDISNIVLSHQAYFF